MAEHVWQVSELIRQINVELFRYNDISVEGEATNVVRSAAGHVYFSIKDARAQMRVVLFATNARFLRFRIENGLQLVVRGRLTLYEQKGEFQLNAVAVEPAGLGALQLALFEETAEAQLWEPTFIIDYPAEVSPLARASDAPGRADAPARIGGPRDAVLRGGPRPARARHRSRD